MQEKQKTIRQSTQRLPLRKGSCHGEAVTERFERNNMDNLSVICFANATSPYTGVATRCGGDGVRREVETVSPL